MGRVPHRRALAAALLAVFGCALTPAAACAADVSVYGSTTMIRPTDAGTGSPGATLTAARNEFESFQVKIDAGSSPLSGVDIELSTPLSGPGGAQIPGANIMLYREALYRVARPSDGELWTQDPCPSDCLIPDALIPKRDEFFHVERNAFSNPGFSLDVPAGQNRVAWVDVLVPKGQAPGPYQGSLRVTGTNAEGKFAQDVSIELDVRGFGLPSTSTLGGAFTATHQRLCPAHDQCAGLDPWSLYEKYARIGLENRISLSRPGYGGPYNSLSKFRAQAVPLLNGTSRARLTGAKLTSIPLNRYEAEHMGTWKSEGATSGFTDRLIFYCDETHKDVEQWKTVCDDPFKVARDNWDATAPGDAGPLPVVKASDESDRQWALGQGFESAGALNTIAPVLREMNPKGTAYPGNKALYDGFKAERARNRLWLYESCESSGCDDPGVSYDDYDPSPIWNGWASYHIDQPPSEARAMPWLAFTYGASGEYYYETLGTLARAWNDCTDNRPDRPLNCQFAAGGNGDGTLFYPGTPAQIGGSAGQDIPVESIRLKRIRDGREDWEYLNRAQSQGRGTEAQTIARDLFPATYDTDRSQAQLDSARDSLAALIADDDPRDAPATVLRAGGPPGGSVTTATTALYSFSATPSDGTTFDCSLDDGPFEACRAPKTIRGLAEGSHTFRVRAENAIGQVDPTPATRSWRVVAPDTPTCHGRLVTVLGDTGTDGDDVMIGTPGDDSIRGLGGDDTICGGAGDDTLAGGAGDDTLDGQGNDDAVDYGDAPSAVEIDLGNGYATGEGKDTLVSFSKAYGSEHDDTLRGSDSNDRLDGRGGADSLTGSGGRDELNGNRGADSIAARDRTTDSVNCGADVDPVAIVDPSDSRAECERTDDGVDRTAPQTTINLGPMGVASSSTAMFGVQSSEAGSFRCSLDGGSFAPCSSPMLLEALGAGVHRLAVQAVDRAGNVDATPAVRWWIVSLPVLPPHFRCTIGARRTSLRGAIRSGVLASSRCTHPAQVTLRLLLSRSTARRLGLARGRRGNAVALAQTTQRADSTKSRLRFSRRVRRSLKRARGVRLTLRADATSSTSTASAAVERRVILRR